MAGYKHQSRVNQTFPNGRGATFIGKSDDKAHKMDNRHLCCVQGEERRRGLVILYTSHIVLAPLLFVAELLKKIGYYTVI